MSDYADFLNRISTKEGLEDWIKEVGYENHQRIMAHYLQYGSFGTQYVPYPVPQEEPKKKKRKSRNLKNRFEILKRDNYKCQICGRTAADGVVLEVDHKVPVDKGGTDHESNLWTTCFDCNRGKSNRDL